jgi:beta-lactamase regulating signal transducer with metallopeptidase domain
MNPLVSAESLALWLADYYLLASVLLFAAIACSLLMKQPAQRLAITKATIAALFLLSILCAIPGWSLVHLFTAAQPQVFGSQAELVERPLAHDVQTLPAGEFSRVEPPITATPPIENNPPAKTTAPSTYWRELAWARIIVAAHATGSALVIAWLVLGAIAAYRLQRTAESAPDELNAVLAEVAALQNVSSHLPDLKISERIDVAVALGIFRPTVLLPTDWLKSHAPEQLRTVLAHELAHVANRDLRWLAASRALVMLLWAQPFLWLLRRRMRLDQEALADAAAAELTSRQCYAKQLVAWARQMPGRAAVHLSAAVGLWERPSHLRQRIALLLNDRFTVLRNCSRGWRWSALLIAIAAVFVLSRVTIETGHTELTAGNEEQLSELGRETVTAAVQVLRETKGVGERTSMKVLAAARVSVADDWAIAIQTLADIGKPAVPHIVKALDEEQRDHAISKLAFALRAIGDPRAVPALIRALPRTLLPSRSDFGLRIEDQDLLRFMQKHDLSSSDRDKDSFDYGRAFREVAGALNKLTGADQNDMELNWVDLGETETQRALQRRLFHDLAQRWADWWSINWERFGVDEQYASVNLPPISNPLERSAASSLPVGPRLGLVVKYAGWIVQSAHESTRRCFVDLDTSRESGWPSALPPVGQLGENSQVLVWGRSQGFDMLGITYQPPGYDAPLYCLQPLDMKVWQITPEQQRDLPRAIRGEIPYPTENPVDRLIPRKEAYEGFNKQQLGGTAFLFLTSEGTAGLLRMTAQVTDTNVQFGRPASPNDQYSPTGFYRGVKLSFAIIAETDNPVQFDTEPPAGARVKLGPQPLPAVPSNRGANAQPGVLPNRPLAERPTQTEFSGSATLRHPLGELRPVSGAQANVIAGRCLDENGRPLAGLKVVLLDHRRRADLPAVKAETTSDASGDYRFENVVDVSTEFPNGRIPVIPQADEHFYQVAIRSAGRVTTLQLASTFELARNGISWEHIIRPAATLQGRVTDPDGNPVSGAFVSLGPTMYRRLEGAQSARTDAEGRYEINDVAPFDPEKFRAEQEAQRQRDQNSRQAIGPPRLSVRVAAGPPLLSVEHPNFGLTKAPCDQIPGTKDVQLEKAAIVEGQVLYGDSGQPAANVLVQAQTRLSDRVPPSRDLLTRAVTVYTRTATDGKFRFTTLPEGTYDFWPLAEGWLHPGAVAETHVGQDTTIPEIRLTRGGIVRIRLVNSTDGQPIAVGPDDEATFSVQQVFAGRVLQAPRKTVKPQPDGTFETRAHPGSNVLTLYVVVSLDQAKWVAAQQRPQLVEIPAAENATVSVDMPVEPAPPSRNGAESPVNNTQAGPEPVEIPIIVARHVLLHDGKIIEWADLEKLIAALPNPRLAHPVFKFTSGGATEKQEEIRAKIWDFRRRVSLNGHTWASVSPDESARYDAMRPTEPRPPIDHILPEVAIPMRVQR